MFGWREILDYWFGELDESGLPDRFHRTRWFRSTKGFDREIRRRFFSMVLIASEGGLDHWRREAGGSLAEIILLDQFSRNIHRGGALAFENDKLAVRLCKSAMRSGHDMALPPVQRAFLYMPLQHSEKMEDQNLAVDCYEQLAAATGGIAGDFMSSFLQSAKDHREIIRSFGRFPHRNQALKRTSSPEEEAYLKSGKRFGQ